jgi:hypothetical protein
MRESNLISCQTRLSMTPKSRVQRLDFGRIPLDNPEASDVRNLRKSYQNVVKEQIKDKIKREAD